MLLAAICMDMDPPPQKKVWLLAADVHMLTQGEMEILCHVMGNF